MTVRSDSAARLVRAAARAAGLGERSDPELLAAFLAGEAAAFEALVRRHGPMVLRVCRAATRCEADADDAFQAAFVRLYRKAAGVRDRRSLAGWLFRVARRVAADARRAADRRARRESAADRPDAQDPPDPSWREACAALHAELDRLPTTYRLPLVLCYLQGLSRDEAADRLGWSLNEVRGRLERGRARLRSRLERRGITLSAGLLAAVAADGLPPTLLQAAVGSAANPPAHIARLAAAGLATRVKVAGLAMAGALAAGAVLLGAGGGAPPHGPPAKDKPAEVKPAPRLDLAGDPLPDGAISRLGTLRFNHGNGLEALQFSADGKWVLSSGGGNARVWDAATGKELRRFTTGKAAYGDRGALTADGRVLLPEPAGGRNTLHIWDVEGGTEVKAVPLPWGDEWDPADRFSPAGRLMTRLRNGSVPVFEVEAGRVLYMLKPDGGAKAAAFAGDDLLVTITGNNRVQTWEAGTGKAVREFDHGGPAVVVAASADGRVLATLEHHTHAIDKYLDKDVVHVWDLSTGKRRHTLAAKPKRWFMGVCLSPDGKRLAATAAAQPASELMVWDTGTGELVHEAANFVGHVMTFTPDGRRLACGLRWGRFELFDLEPGRPVKPADSRFMLQPAVALSPDGARVSLTSYCAVSTWDAATGRRLTAHEVPPFGSMDPVRRLSPDGRYTSTYEGDFQRGRLVIRETATGKAVLTVDPGISDVGFAPDGIRIAARSDVGMSPTGTRVAVRTWDDATKTATLQVYDLATGKVAHSIRQPKGEWVQSLSLVEDGKTLVACGHQLVGYSVEDGRELFVWRIPRAVVKDPAVQSNVGPEPRIPWRVFTVSPDGSLAAGLLAFEDFGRNALPGRLLICDARTGQVLHRCSDSGRQGANRGAVRFSADGRLLASSDGYRVHLWEAATGKRVRTLDGHRGEVADLAFSGNSRRLASASYDSTVLVWDLSAPAAGEPDRWWADLASDDAAAGYAAVWRLADAPDDVTLPLLRKHLRPVEAGEAERVGKLIADLNAGEFRTRERASSELAGLGSVARPALRAARDGKPSAEAAARLDQLLAKVVGPPSTGEGLRTWRVLAVLEAKGTPGARKFLRELADGADGWLTTEARAALRRLER